ncbi:MAG: ABC transporter permease [Verrucomicrobiota bacterium]
MKPLAHPSFFRRLRNLLGEVKESFFMAMNALASHKLRSALTLLGVLVGVFSIIVVMTAMRAMKKRIETELDVLGGQTFAIQKMPGITFEQHDEKYRRRKSITLAQGMELKKRATLARSVGLETGFDSGDMYSAYAKAPPNVSLLGETPDSFPAQNWVIEEGRVFSESDLERARGVCVLGNSLAKVLFPFGSGVGERVKINGIDSTVIGILAAKGSVEGGNQDNFALIPITTGFNRFGNRHNQDVAMLVQARDQAHYDDTVEQVRGVLRLLRKVPPGEEDDFEILSKDSMLEQINTFTRAVRIGVMLVSSIALVAAGIGIMNIMLVSVTERTREIGIRRAIGAKKRNIMAQFIMEAVMLCEFGGVIGVLLGVLGGNLAAHFLKLPAVIPVDWVLIGLGICSLVGMVFGTYPAFKAANLDPIESLRYE